MSVLATLGTLFVGIAAIISALTAVGAFWVSVRRGSDRENRRAAEIAAQILRNNENPQGDNNVIYIEVEDTDGHERH